MKKLLLFSLLSLCFMSCVKNETENQNQRFSPVSNISNKDSIQIKYIGAALENNGASNYGFYLVTLSDGKEILVYKENGVSIIQLN